jgi:hypothetical protein
VALFKAMGGGWESDLPDAQPTGLIADAPEKN